MKQLTLILIALISQTLGISSAFSKPVAAPEKAAVAKECDEVDPQDDDSFE